MPILNLDLKGLEWRTILELSQDKVGIDEVIDGDDVHTINKNRFNLPSRLIAKVFLFRWIYYGSAYAYSVDPDFSSVDTGRGTQKQVFWQAVIDAANEKYSGIARWHRDTINTVVRTGKYVSPLTGRIYEFKPRMRKGDAVWPESQIVNFPNQGLGADIIALIRAEYFKSYSDDVDYSLPILTVHDSLVFDCKYGKTCSRSNPPWYETYLKVQDLVRNKLSSVWSRKYGSPLVVPHDVEAEVGINYGNMHKIV